MGSGVMVVAVTVAEEETVVVALVVVVVVLVEVAAAATETVAAVVLVEAVAAVAAVAMVAATVAMVVEDSAEGTYRAVAVSTAVATPVDGAARSQAATAEATGASIDRGGDPVAAANCWNLRSTFEDDQRCHLIQWRRGVAPPMEPVAVVKVGVEGDLVVFQGV